MAEPLLRLSNIRAGYDGAVVLDGISLEVAEGGSLAVLGRNGVGKTTLLLTIMGFTDVRDGTVELRGRDITTLTSHRRAREGLGWVPQERDIFPSLSVEENLAAVARPGTWGPGTVYDLFPRLADRRKSMGNQLSGGEQQMLAIARTLVTNPSLLLLDEPLEGLAPIVVEELTAAIERMRAEQNTALVLVEQHVEIALALTDVVVVIERGTIAYQGASGALLEDKTSLDRLIGLDLAGPES